MTSSARCHRQLLSAPFSGTTSGPLSGVCAFISSVTQRTCRVVSLEVDPLLEERAGVGVRKASRSDREPASHRIVAVTVLAVHPKGQARRRRGQSRVTQSTRVASIGGWVLLLDRACAESTRRTTISPPTLIAVGSVRGRGSWRLSLEYDLVATGVQVEKLLMAVGRRPEAVRPLPDGDLVSLPEM